MERTDQQGPQPTPGDVLMAARRTDHLAHCTNCREQAEATEAQQAEYGASIQRRDRIQLGLRLTERARAVSA